MYMKSELQVMLQNKGRNFHSLDEHQWRSYTDSFHGRLRSNRELVGVFALQETYSNIIVVSWVTCVFVFREVSLVIATCHLHHRFVLDLFVEQNIHCDIHWPEVCLSSTQVLLKWILCQSLRMKLIWAIIWLIILLVIGIWVASLCAGIYVLLSIFTPCFPPLDSIAESLKLGIDFANYCVKNMLSGKPLFWRPKRAQLKCFPKDFLSW